MRGIVLDIGGEGRHPGVWNLNPRPLRTVGVQRGARIPCWIRGRGEAIPLPTCSVDGVIVERTPLLTATLTEIRRVAKPHAWVLLRHALVPLTHPHTTALRMLPGIWQCCTVRMGSQVLLETTIQLTPFY